MKLKELEIQILDRKIYPTIFQTVQLDSKRILKFILTDYELTDDMGARFSAKKPSGKPILNECFIRDGFIFYKVTKQTVAEVGITNCQLVLYDKITGKEITSFTFKMDVQKKIVSEECITSTADWGVIETLKTEVTEMYDEVLRAMENGGWQPLDVIDSLDSHSTIEALSANMGRFVKELVDSHVDDISNPHTVTPNQIGAYDKAEVNEKIVAMEAMSASDILNICN